MDKLWTHIVSFLTSFDLRQIRYMGPDFTATIEDAADIARRNYQVCGRILIMGPMLTSLWPALAITPIADALLRLDPSGSVLTSSHLYLVKLAIESEEYKGAVPVLEKPIMYFPASANVKGKHLCDVNLPPSVWISTHSFSAKFKSIDVLEYFYLSGMCLIGLRKWENALQCLENAIVYPLKDQSVSKIQAEAYKKWCIVSLLHTGKAFPLPKSTNGNASRVYHVFGKPYEAVASLFETGTASRLRSEVEFGQNVWAHDFNTGLMLELLASYQKWQIRKLAKTYSKISIPEIVSLTMSAETGNRQPASVVEGLIQEMLSDGSLPASLSRPANLAHAVLTFVSAGPVLTESEMQKELNGATQRIRYLTRELKNTDHMLAQHKSYVDYLLRVRKQKAGQGHAGMEGMGMEMDWNEMVEDEDIMTGY